MMWIVYTLISALFMAIYYWGNQAVRLSPSLFMFYRGFVPAALLLPFAPFVPLIPSTEFYACCAAQGLIIAFIDRKNFIAMQRWGAKTVSAIHPFGIVAVFFIWLLFKPSAINFYLGNPPYLFGVFLSFAGIIYAVSAFTPSPETKKALFYMIPYLLISALCDVMNKVCMSFVPADLRMSGSFFYILTTGAVVAAVNLPVCLRSGEKPTAGANLRCTPVFLLLIGSMGFKNFAMANAVNPSFVSALLYSYILWLAVTAPLAEKIGIKATHTRISPFKTAVLLAAVVLLVLIRQ